MLLGQKSDCTTDDNCKLRINRDQIGIRFFQRFGYHLSLHVFRRVQLLIRMEHDEQDNGQIFA